MVCGHIHINGVSIEQNSTVYAAPLMFHVQFKGNCLFFELIHGYIYVCEWRVRDRF